MPSGLSLPDPCKGARLAATTATNAALEGLEGGWNGYSSAVQAVGSVCGPMNLLASDLTTPGDVLPLLGGTLQEKPALARQASRLAHVSAGAPPFCLIHGAQDDVVPVSQAREMHGALSAAGVSSELTELSGDHYINETHRADVEERLPAFFRAQLAPIAGN